MTIVYQHRVANAKLGTFVKLLAMWRGSVYKLVYKEMFIFIALYTAISLTYRLALNADQRETFEKIVLHFSHYTSLIPISFVLGFYVSLVVHRWWTQFMNVPWPDRTLFMTCCYLHGTDEKSKIMRRTIARYMMFGLILICRSISVAVMKRFPTLDHIVESGFISKEEAIMYEQVDCKYNKFWVPLLWANSVLVQARRENKIETDWGLRMIIEQLADFRDKCSTCFVYDWITIPLVYTQVVTLSVYTFFGANLISRQFLDPTKQYPGYEYDLYVPIFTLIQFFFYMGWLKVAEQLINPFGEDDDDFDINWLLDRHMAVAMTLVDQMYGVHPPLLKDMHFNEIGTELPYTEASLPSKRPMFLGSTYNLAVPTLNEQKIVLPEEQSDLRRRTTSFGSHFNAGSVLSLFTGRPSTYSKPYYQQSHDHLHVPGHQMDYLSHTNQNGHVINQNNRHFSSTQANDLSSWSSDSDFIGRERSKTDVDQRLLDDVQKEKQRKISFPLSLLKRLTSSHSRSSSNSGTPKNSNSNVSVDTCTIPEYVPLKRAAVKPDSAKRKLSNNSDRKRKSSFPLNLIRKQLSEDESGSTHSVPGSTEALRSKSSRFTIEHVADTINTDDNSVHWRNAQKIEKAIGGKVVSRAPLLSAIEEANTVNSLSQILPSDDEDEMIGTHMFNPLTEIAESNEKEGCLDTDERDNANFNIPTIVIDEC